VKLMGLRGRRDVLSPHENSRSGSPCHFNDGDNNDTAERGKPGCKPGCKQGWGKKLKHRIFGMLPFKAGAKSPESLGASQLVNKGQNATAAEKDNATAKSHGTGDSTAKIEKKPRTVSTDRCSQLKHRNSQKKDGCVVRYTEKGGRLIHCIENTQKIVVAVPSKTLGSLFPGLQFPNLEASNPKIRLGDILIFNINNLGVELY
jgi:hypothetical protein